MYRKSQRDLGPEGAFELPFEGQLSEENRWVVLSKLIPWSEFEAEYAQNFSEDMGATAKSFRIALGALIIKEKLGISDRETVEQIQENPYLQYFIGQNSYQNEAPFDPSMMVHFRKRITPDLLQKINRRIVQKSLGFKPEDPSPKKLEEAEKQKENRGRLLMDATVSPADIKYPTDVELLNQARKTTESIIDLLYKFLKDNLDKKPRTYRKKARKDYLNFAKKRKHSQKERKEAVKKQLQYIKRNLGHIDRLIAQGASLELLSRTQYRNLLVSSEIYRQQDLMWSNNQKRIDHRIVSLTQPHVRPIVRGKSGSPTEFGAKLSVSCVEGYVLVENISWENYNESGDFISQVEAYKELTGFYPESVHADKIYRTRVNRAWCKERGIRLSGPPLGRPPDQVTLPAKKQAQEDERIRNEIEGKFGQGKRRFSLNRVMAKLANTSETSINLTFLVLNLVKLLRQFYCLFLCQFFQTIIILYRSINFSYTWNNPSKALFIGAGIGASCSFTPPAFYNFFSKP
ncbi:IS5 family transposase [Laspinema olomoucense]|uniref:IS5 family transposase n=1 Tax=Laspinema olomoucense TaxID=3231600 RepID=UPI0021BAEC9D|nr:IS5 family transposase [Laspinema sp. D3c]MCT7992169.1 IS5 family transposase [Laspinema sp. D3c]